MLLSSNLRPSPLVLVVVAAFILLGPAVYLYPSLLEAPAFRFLGPAGNKSPFDQRIPPIPKWCKERLRNATAESSEGGARALSPKDLLCRKVDTKSGRIPKLLHQSWKSSELPAKFKTWSDGCRKMHPDWEWVLWTDEDNLELVRAYYPWLEKTFLDLPGPIYRADLSRNLYMHMFGGVYADLDMNCLRNTAEALASPSLGIPNVTESTQGHRGLAVFGLMDAPEGFDDAIPNAWMASTPRFPLFLLPLEWAERELRRSQDPAVNPELIRPSPEYLTGPGALGRVINRWQKGEAKKPGDEVHILPPQYIYPYSWALTADLRPVCSTEEDTFDQEVCKKRVDVEGKGSLTITYWSHTHDGDKAHAENTKHVSSK